MNVFLVLTTADIQMAAFAVQFAPALLASGDTVSLLCTGAEHDLAAYLLREIDGVSLTLRSDLSTDSDKSAWIEAYLYRRGAEAEIDIVYFLGSGGFHAIRRRRFAASPRPICVTVLQEISAQMREESGQYPEIPKDLDEDFAEQYAIRHSDFLAVSRLQTLQWLTDRRWQIPNNTHVQPFLSDWHAFHDEIRQAAQARKPSPPEPLPRVAVCLLTANGGEMPAQASESLKAQTADNFTVTTLADVARSDPAAEFLILLSAQVTVASNFVSRTRDAMLRSSDDCLMLPIQTVSADGSPDEDPPAMPLGNILSEFLTADRSPLTALILRRAAWDSVAGSLTAFDSRLIRQHLIAAGFKIDVLPETLVSYQPPDDPSDAEIEYPERADLPIGDLAELPAVLTSLRQEVDALRNQRSYRWDRLVAPMNQAIRREVEAHGAAVDASIVIPVYNALEFARACVESIYRVACDRRFEVIVVDNGSAPDMQDWLDAACAQHPALRALRLDQNYGFSRAITEGTRIAVGRNLLFLNSDTLVTDGWLDRLIEVADGDASLGVVGPVSNRVGQDFQIEPDAVGLATDQVQHFADTIRNRREVLISPQRLVFFCALVKRHVWDLLGGFGADYGIGTYEDDDFCLRAKLAGYRLAIARDVFVYHHESATFAANKIDYNYWLSKNWQLYHQRLSSLSSVLLPSRNVLKSPSGPVEVSVIVVRNGSRDTLRTALTSLANQTMHSFEVILIDDCRDDVLSLVGEFQAHLRLTRLVHWGNWASALNAGLRAARGRFLTSMLDDDLMYPQHLEILWSTLTRQREAEAPRVACCNFSFALVGTGNTVKSRQPGIDDNVSLAQFKRYNPLPIQSSMVARSCLDVVGDFDETLNILPVWDFNIRLADHFPFAYVRFVVTSECRFYDGDQDSQAVAYEAARIYERYGLKDLQESDEWITSAVAEKAIVPKDWLPEHFQNDASTPGQRARSDSSYDVLDAALDQLQGIPSKRHELSAVEEGGDNRT